MTVGIVEVHTPTVVPVVDLALVAAHGERPWMVYPVQHRPIRSTMRLAVDAPLLRPTAPTTRLPGDRCRLHRIRARWRPVLGTLTADDGTRTLLTRTPSTFIVVCGDRCGTRGCAPLPNGKGDTMKSDTAKSMRTFAGVGLVVGGIVLAGGTASAAPSEGRGGHKTVEQFEFGPFPGPLCESGETLMVEGEGWQQTFPSPTPEGNRNLEHAVFHIDVTYTNAAGDTWVWKDRGPDRIFLLDGVPHIAITGRSGFSGVIGQVVLDLVTFEIVKVAGNPVGEGGPAAVDAAACDALT